MKSVKIIIPIMVVLLIALYGYYSYLSFNIYKEIEKYEDSGNLLAVNYTKKIIINKYPFSIYYFLTDKTLSKQGKLIKNEIINLPDNILNTENEIYHKDEQVSIETKINKFEFSDFNDIGIINAPKGYTNVRQKPSVESQILTIVREDEQFKINTKNGNWWEIETNKGIVGFMRKSRIKIVKDRGQGKYPEASDRLLRNEDLAGLSKWDLRVMRNEIFARHGYVFKTQVMSKYFNNLNWYNNIKKLDNNNNVSSLLTNIEKKNIKLIQDLESKSNN